MMNRQSKRSTFAKIKTRGRLAAVMLLVVLGLTPSVQSAPRIPSQTLIVAQGPDTRCLSPLFANAQQENNASMQVVERLIRLSPDGKKYVPELATEWTVTNDRTIQFRLRRGVKFTNGEPFNAQAVKYSTEQLIKSRAYASLVTSLEGAEVVAEYTVNVKTKEATASNLVLNALVYGGFQYPPGYTQQVGIFEGFCKQPIGTGPFKFIEWIKDDHIRLEANATYWGGAPRIRTVIFRPISEGLARIAALEAGDIVLTVDVPLDALDRVRNNSSLMTYSMPGMRAFFVHFVTKYPGPLTNKLVRQGLGYAVDVPSIIKNVLGGQARALDGQIMTPEVFGYNPTLKPTPFDPERAKRLLAQGGYPNGIDITFTYTSGRYPQDKEVSEAIAAQLARVGVRTRQVVLETGEFFNQILRQQLRGIYYLGVLPVPDANFVYSFYLCDAPFSFYCNKDFDVLVKKAAVTTDTKERLRTYNVISRIANADPIGIFLFAPQDLYASSKRLKGWQPASSQVLDFAKSTVE